MADSEELKKFRRRWKEELMLPDELVESGNDDSPGNPAADGAGDRVYGNISENDSDKLERPGQAGVKRKWRRDMPIYDDVTIKPKKTCFFTQNIEAARSKSNVLNSFILAEKLLQGSEDGAGPSCSYKPRKESVIFKLSNEEDRKFEIEQLHRNTEQCDERYLDIFLADLEDINEIPFFDHELARELALKIFKYLGMLDLCRCSQVSRAWRSLAEDEYLWTCLCRQKGYDLNILTVERTNWKEIAKEHILNQRVLDSNWKTRTGRLYRLDHAQGGILCAVSSWEHHVVAGYTNGEVKYWDVLKGEECVFQPSNKSLVIDEASEQGTLTNYVSKVAVNDHTTVAGYSQGTVDIWSNSTGTKPCHSFKGPSHVTQLEVAWKQEILAVGFNTHVSVRYMDGTLIDSMDCDSYVRRLRLAKRESDYNTMEQLVVVAERESIKAFIPGDHQSNVSMLHCVVDQEVDCMDCRGNQLAFSVHCQGGPLEELFQLKLLDLESGKEKLHLRNLTSPASCLNYKDSPEHMLILGNKNKSIEIIDSRIGESVMQFWGHAGLPLVVQMDETKAASGGMAGLLCVWDQRMAGKSSKLWESHDRHCVEYLHFTKELLVSGNIPSGIFPLVEEYDHMQHLRKRGSAKVFNFSATPSSMSTPGICLSSYDEPEAYNYNVRLALPYDDI